MLCRKCKKEIPGDSVLCCYCGIKVNPKRGGRQRGNGTGSAYKEGKTYTAVAVMGYKKGLGKKGVEHFMPIKTTKGGFPTRKAALDYIPNLKADYEAAHSVAAPIVELTAADVALKTMWEGYQTTKMYNKLGSNTKSAYKTAWNKISSLHNVDIRTLDVSDMQKIIDAKCSSFDTAKDVQGVLSHCYKWAMVKQYATTNLAQLLTLPDNEPDETIPFSEKEIDKLWGAYGDGDKLAGLSLLMIYSGMMPGELLKARKQMIDWDNQLIVGAGLKTKKRKTTPIVIADFMVPVLREICDGSESDSLCHLSRDKFYEAFKEMVARIDCRAELTPYSCRHSTATGLALLDIPQSVMMEVMRQKKFTTTQRYIHIDVGRSLEAVNALKIQKKKAQNGTENASIDKVLTPVRE